MRGSIVWRVRAAATITTTLALLATWKYDRSVIYTQKQNADAATSTATRTHSNAPASDQCSDVDAATWNEQCSAAETKARCVRSATDSSFLVICPAFDSFLPKQKCTWESALTRTHWHTHTDISNTQQLAAQHPHSQTVTDTTGKQTWTSWVSPREQNERTTDDCESGAQFMLLLAAHLNCWLFFWRRRRILCWKLSKARQEDRTERGAKAKKKSEYRCECSRQNEFDNDDKKFSSKLNTKICAESDANQSACSLTEEGAAKQWAAATAAKGAVAATAIWTRSRTLSWALNYIYSAYVIKTKTKTIVIPTNI